MSNSKDDMRRAFTENIPGLGDLFMYYPGTGPLIDAIKAAHETKAPRKARVFSNLIIAEMASEPQFTVDEVDALPDETRSAIVHFAIRLLDEGDQHREPTDDELYRAGQQHFDRFATSVSEMARDHLESQLRNLSRSVARIADPAQEAIRAFYAKLSEPARQLIDRSNAEIEAFLDSGWPIAPSMPGELRSEVVELHEAGDLASIDASIVAHYRDNDFNAIWDMVEHWMGAEEFTERILTLKDSVRAHIESRFAISIPASIPHIEGWLLEFSIRHSPNPKVSYKEVLAALNDDERLENFPFDRYSAAVVLGRHLPSRTFAEAWSTNELQKPRNERTISRHTILHGVPVDYQTERTSLETLLTLDALTVLPELAPLVFP